MDHLSIYKAALFVLAAALVGIGIFTLRLNPDNLEKYEPLPRNRVAGGIFTFVALLWCVPQVRPIIWTSWLPLLYPLVIVCTFLAVAYLDYLLSRGFGGFMILASYYFVHASFTYHTAGAHFFAILCWVMGIVGIFFSGKPHLMRDLIRKCCLSPVWRFGTTAYCFIFALFALVAGILYFC